MSGPFTKPESTEQLREAAPDLAVALQLLLNADTVDKTYFAEQAACEALTKAGLPMVPA